MACLYQLNAYHLDGTFETYIADIFLAPTYSKRFQCCKTTALPTIPTPIQRLEHCLACSRRPTKIEGALIYKMQNFLKACDRMEN